MSRVIQVVVVEDDPATRKSLELDINRSPGLRCIGNFDSVETAMEALPELAADVVLMDLSMPGGADGNQGTELVKRGWPRIKVLVLTGDDRKVTILETFACGADGYLLKHSSPRELLADSIKDVYAGGCPMADAVRRVLRGFHHERTRLLAPLSPKEKRVMEELDTGATYKEAAANLEMSFDTLKEHMKRIVRKALSSSRGQASFVHRLGIF